MKHVLTTAPSELAVSVAEAKSHCRVDGTAEDAWFTNTVGAAVRMCEEMCDRAFVTQTWVLALDAFPSTSGECCDDPDRDGLTSAGEIVLPRAKVRSVDSIEYYDAAGDLQTLSASVYQLDDLAEPGRVKPAPGQAWPATEAGRYNAVRITYQCGYGAAAAVDPRAKQAVLFLVNHWYENRGAVLVGSISKEIEQTLAATLAQLWPGKMW